MAIKGGDIKFGVSFEANSSQSGLSKIIQELRQVQNQAKKNPLKQGFEEAGAAAKQLESIITGSWNDKLNQLNLSKLNQSIKESYGGIDKLKDSLGKASIQGQYAFNSFATEVLHANMQIRESSKLLDDMATSMANTVKWGITSSIFNNITGTIQKAYYFSKDLDTSLNNIRIVTGDSADQMERFAKYANDTAKNLGRSTLDYTNTALTFYQQGLDEQEVRARTETTLRAQNITGTGSQMADYLTSVWNGFKVNLQDTEKVVDKLAKVADSSASDMSQLAIAMSKVASTANVMGVDIDQLNAQLATVIAVTRQAPESVGTAFKTIYTRLNDIQAGADEAEVSLGNYSGKMAALGFNVLDTSGKLRDTGQVIEQIGSKWQTLSREQQITLAQTMGGTRQVNQVITLFDNWKMYTDLLNDSINSQGSLLEKNNIYLESTAAHTKALGTQVERTYQILSDTKAINAVVDVLKSGLTIFNNFIQGIGGGINTFTYFGSLLTSVFSKQIAESILKAKNNLQLFLDTRKIEDFKKKLADSIIETNQALKPNKDDAVEYQALNKAATLQAELYADSLKARKGLNQQQQKELNNIEKRIGKLTEEKEILSNIEKLKSDKEYAGYNSQMLDNQAKQTEKINKEISNYLLLLKQKREIQEKIGNSVPGDDVEKENARLQEIQEKLKGINNILKDSEQAQGEWYKKTDKTAKVEEELKNKYQENQSEITRILQLKELVAKAERGEIENLDEQIKRLLRMRQQYDSIGKTRVDTTKIVRSLSGIAQAVSAWAGAAKTLSDETATSAEKANAAFSGVQGTISAIGSYFGPMGMAISTITNSVLSLAKEINFLGLGDWLQGFFYNIDQELEKVKQINKTALENTKTYKDTRQEISSLKEQWDQLNNKSRDFTDEERQRYNEIAQKLNKHNEGIIEGYNERGDAIIANNNAIQDTLKVLDEQYEKIMRNTYSGQNLQKILEADKYQSIQEDIAQQERHQRQQSLPMVDIFRNQLQYNPLFDIHNLSFLSENLRILSQEDLQKITTEKNKLLEAIDSADGDFEQIKTALLDFKENIGGDEFLKQQGREDLQQGFNIIFDQVEDFLKDQAPLKQKIEQLNEELKKYTKFDTHEILSILIWNEDKGYSHQYNALKEKFGEDWTTVGEDFVNTILTSYIKGLQYGEDDIKSKEDAIKASQVYLSGLIESGIDFSSFADTKDKILNITSKSLNGYEEELITIINDFLKNNQEIQNLINSDSQENKNLVQSIIKGLIGDSDTGDIEIQNGQIKDIVLKSQQKIQEAIDNIKTDDENFKFEVELTNYLKGLNEEDLNKTLQILKGIDLQGIQTFDDLTNAISDAQAEAKELQQSLSFKDQLSVLDKLSKGESPDSVKGGLDFLLGIQADNPQLKEKAMQAGGRFSEEFINAAKEQMLADRKTLLEAVNRNLEDALEAYDNLEGTQEQKLQSQEAQKVIQLQTQSAQLQSEIKQLTEESAQEVDKLAQSYKKQIDLQTKGKQAYASMLAGNNLTDEQAAAVAVLAQQLGKTDELNRARAAGNQQYMRQTKEILDLQDQLIKSTQQQRIQKAKTERQELENRKAILQTLIEEEDLNYRIARKQFGEDSEQANKALAERNAYIEEYSQLTEDLINKTSELAILQNQLSEEEISKINKAKQAYLSFQDVMSSILQNQSATEDQINGLNQVFEQLISNHADLKDQVDLLRQVELAGTQEYKDALYQIRDALSSDLFGALIESAEQAYEQIDNLQDIDIEVDPEGFLKWVDQVEDYLSVDKTITINVHSDAENMFNDMVAQMDNIQDAASKIGQNFIVAAQDLRTINSVFPGILNGMQQLQNGSIQLSRTAVQNAIATASTIAEEDLKSTQDQLQHQADLLRKKGDIYKAMAQIANKLGNQQVQSEEERSELKAQMGEKLRDLQINNEKIASIEKANTAKKQTKASKQSSEVFVANQVTSKRIALDAEKSYAQQVIQYQNMVAQARAAAASGQTIGFVVPEVHMDNVGYVAQTADISADDDSDLQAQILNLMNSSDLNREEWRRLGDQLEQRANVNYNLASDIDAMIATMSNREYNMQRGLNNVAAGHEYDYDPSENSNNNSNNNRNSSSPRSSTPRSSSPRSSSSSSPRSSSSSTSTSPQTPRDPDFIQFLQDQRDIYHDINIHLELLDEQLSRIKQKQDKLAGSKLIDALNEELQLLDRQIAAYKEKSRIAQDEMGELQARLRGAGVTFDENGQVSNYSTIMASQINYVNAVIQRYNHMTAEQQQQYKAVVEQVKENYQHFVQDMSRYDQLMSQQIPELENRIQQAVNRQIEISITKFNMTVDIELDLTKAKREWQDFENKVIRRIRPDNILENARSNYQSLFTYLGPGVDEINSQTVHIQEILDQLKIMENGGWSSIYGDNTAKALEDLKKYQQGLMNSLEEVEDIIEDIKQSIFDGIDQAQQAFDKQVDTFDYISDLINHDVKLINLIYGDKAYQMMSQYYDKQQQNDNKQVDFLRQQVNFWHNRMEAEKKRMLSLQEGSREWEDSKKVVQEYTKHWMDSVQNLNSAVEDSVSNLIDKYTNSIDNIFSKLQDKLTNGLGMETVAEEWELINKQSDMYYDTINSAYEIQKLRDKYQQAIKDNEGNINAQKSLNTLMEQQLEMLKDKEHLSEYDVKRADLLLQIETKRLALQNTRASKTKLRLRRDSQGNYSYQYTADEQNIDKGQSELADLQNQLYNLSKTTLKNNLDDFYSTVKDYHKKLRDVYADTTLSAEQRQKKIAMLNKYYGDIINNMLEDNTQLRKYLSEDAFAELANMYNIDAENFTNMADQQKQVIMESLVPQWDSGVQTMIDKFVGQGGFIPTVSEALNELKQTNHSYQEDLDALSQAAGINFEQIANGYDQIIPEVQSLLEVNDQLINTYGEELDAIQQVIDLLGALMDSYRSVREQAISAAAAAQGFRVASQESTRENALVNPGTNNPTTSSNDNLLDSGSYHSSSGGVVVTHDPMATLIGGPIVGGWNDYLSSMSYQDWQRYLRSLPTFDTGGYTGSWGDEKRLAFVHEKQLILNHEDTKNLLRLIDNFKNAQNALETENLINNFKNIQEALDIESFINTFKNKTKQLLQTFSEPLLTDGSSIGRNNLLIPSNDTASNNTSQTVYLTANFPNANDRNEIEIALNNLLNRASQWVGR